VKKYQPHDAAHAPLAKRVVRQMAEPRSRPNFCPIAYAAVLEVLG
jgi:hypothetical protein